MFVAGIGSGIFELSTYDYLPVNTLYIRIDPSPHPAAIYLSLGSKRTQKVDIDKSPSVYL